MNKNITLKAILISTGTIIILLIAIFFIYYYGFVRPNVIASYNFDPKKPVLMTVYPSEKVGVSLSPQVGTTFKNLPGVTAVSPLFTYTAEIDSNTTKGETIVYGVTPKLFELENISVDFGSHTFSNENAREAIISIGLLKSIGISSPIDALGNEYDFNLTKIDNNGIIQKKSIRLKITGVTKEPNTKYLYTPLNVVNVFGTYDYSKVKIQAKDLASLMKVRKQVEAKGYPTESVADVYIQVLERTRFPWDYYTTRSLLLPSDSLDAIYN